MQSYVIPEINSPEPVSSNEVLLVANGDLRQSANRVCWPAQASLEQMLTEAFLEEGINLRRAPPYDPELKHGFIYSQRMVMSVFEHIHPEAPIVVAEAVWQYSAHLMAGLQSHRGPILTVANWSGQWPGGHVESEWQSAQSRSALHDAVEQGLQGSVVQARSSRVDPE